MGSSEKFCLRWNDFESNISVAFREIREEKDFFDCTLSCGSRQIQAHKLILSACSPFFRSVLRQNPHQHPLLYLKGVEFIDLQAILNFMYHGEVNVAQEELNSFLTVAEDLQVKGLTQNKSASQPTPQHQKTEANLKLKPRFPNKHSPILPIPQTTKLSNKTQATENYGNPHQDDDDVQEVTVPEVKKEPQISRPYCTPDPDPLIDQLDITNNEETHTMGMQMATTEENYVEEEYDYGEYEVEAGEMAGYQGQGVDTSHGVADSSSYLATELNGAGVKVFSCQLCGKVFKQKPNAKTHVESVHVTGVQVNCGICAKIFKNKESLKTHFRIKHGLAKNQAF